MTIDVPEALLCSAITDALRKSIAGYDGIAQQLVNKEIKTQLGALMKGALSRVMADAAFELEIAGIVRGVLRDSIKRRVESVVRQMPAPAFREWVDRQTHDPGVAEQTLTPRIP